MAIEENELDRVVEKIDRFYEAFNAHATVDIEKFTALKMSLESLRDSFMQHVQLKDRSLELFEGRVRKLEDFTLKFAAKFSMVAAIVMFLGTIIAQLVVAYLQNTIIP